MGREEHPAWRRHPDDVINVDVSEISSARLSINCAKDSSTVTRNHPRQTLSPRPSPPTRFMPSFQSPSPIKGRP